MYYFHRETHTMLRAAILLVVLFISSSSIPNLTIGFGEYSFGAAVAYQGLYLASEFEIFLYTQAYLSPVRFFTKGNRLLQCFIELR